MTNGFNVVAIGVDNKCAVVIRVVLGTQAWRAIRRCPGSQCCHIEGIYGIAGNRRKSNMLRHGLVFPCRRFEDTELRFSAKPEARTKMRLLYQLVTQTLKYAGIKAQTGSKGAYRDADVVKKGRMRHQRRCTLCHDTNNSKAVIASTGCCK
jgi:hypothetical protein